LRWLISAGRGSRHQALPCGRKKEEEGGGRTLLELLGLGADKNLDLGGALLALLERRLGLDALLGCERRNPTMKRVSSRTRGRNPQTRESVHAPSWSLTSFEMGL